MSNDRDRLIEIIYCAGRDYDDYVDNQHEMGMPAHEDFDEWLADELLANGVILPPIKKVGEKLYFHQFNNKLEKVVVEGEIIKISNDERKYLVKLKDGRKLTFIVSFFGKTVFLTKEEAEQALATDTNVGIKKECE